MNKTEVENKYKGYIECPCCGAKTFVEKGAHGRVSTQCKCKKYLVFDYDAMTAVPAKAVRGLSQYFRSR